MIVFLLCNLAIPFPVDFSVKFSNNKRNNFQILSAYWCISLIHLDSVYFGNRLVINAWWQCFLWKISRLPKLEIDFGVLFLEHVIQYLLSSQLSQVATVPCGIRWSLTQHLSRITTRNPGLHGRRLLRSNVWIGVIINIYIYIYFVLLSSCDFLYSYILDFSRGLSLCSGCVSLLWRPFHAFKHLLCTVNRFYCILIYSYIDEYPDQ